MHTQPTKHTKDWFVPVHFRLFFFILSFSLSIFLGPNREKKDKPTEFLVEKKISIKMHTIDWERDREKIAQKLGQDQTINVRAMVKENNAPKMRRTKNWMVYGQWNLMKVNRSEDLDQSVGDFGAAGHTRTRTRIATESFFLLLPLSSVVVCASLIRIVRKCENNNGKNYLLENCLNCWQNDPNGHYYSSLDGGCVCVWRYYYGII